MAEQIGSQRGFELRQVPWPGLCEEPGQPELDTTQARAALQQIERERLGGIPSAFPPNMAEVDREDRAHPEQPHHLPPPQPEFAHLTLHPQTFEPPPGHAPFPPLAGRPPPRPTLGVASREHNATHAATPNPEFAPVIHDLFARAGMANVQGQDARLQPPAPAGPAGPTGEDHIASLGRFFEDQRAGDPPPPPPRQPAQPQSGHSRPRDFPQHQMRAAAPARGADHRLEPGRTQANNSNESMPRDSQFRKPEPRDSARHGGLPARTGTQSDHRTRMRNKPSRQRREKTRPKRAAPRGDKKPGVPFVRRLEHPISVPLHALDDSVFEVLRTVTPPDVEDGRRQSLLRHLTKIVRKEWPTATLSLFGSSANLLALKGADVDLCLVIPQEDCFFMAPSREESETPVLEKVPLTSKMIIRRAASLLRRAKMKNIDPLLSARVPIVKFYDEVSQLNVDLSCNNVLGRHNTALQRKYVGMDIRVRQLGLLIKYWAKRRAVNEPYRGTLGSYAYLLLVISYLQHTRPPVLPCLQEGREACVPSSHPELFVEGCNVYFNSRYSGITSNQQSVGELLLGFFRYFAYHFDYEHKIISVRCGRILQREEREWFAVPEENSEEEESPEPPEDHKDGNKTEDRPRRRRRDQHHFCIEDPFDLSHDLGRTADLETLAVMQEEFTRAAEILASRGDFAEVCAQFEEAA